METINVTSKGSSQGEEGSGKDRRVGTRQRDNNGIEESQEVSSRLCAEAEVVASLDALTNECGTTAVQVENLKYIPTHGIREE